MTKNLYLILLYFFYIKRKYNFTWEARNTQFICFKGGRVSILKCTLKHNLFSKREHFVGFKERKSFSLICRECRFSKLYHTKILNDVYLDIRICKSVAQNFNPISTSNLTGITMKRVKRTQICSKLYWVTESLNRQIISNSKLLNLI